MIHIKEHLYRDYQEDQHEKYDRFDKESSSDKEPSALRYVLDYIKEISDKDRHLFIWR